MVRSVVAAWAVAVRSVPEVEVGGWDGFERRLGW